MIRLPSIARAQFLGSWSLSFYDFPFPDRVLFLTFFFFIRCFTVERRHKPSVLRK